MSTRNSEQSEHIRDKLEALKSALADQLALAESTASLNEPLDQSKVGRLSRMDAIQQQNMARSTMEQTKKRLALVNAALARIDSDDFGYCASCADKINPARLEAQPYATLCLKCQSRQEQQ